MRSPPSILYGASLTKELLSFHREPTSRLRFSTERHTFLSIFRSRIGPGTSAGRDINISDFIFERFSISIDSFPAYLRQTALSSCRLCIMFFLPSKGSVRIMQRRYSPRTWQRSKGPDQAASLIFHVLCRFFPLKFVKFDMQRVNI